MIVMPIVMPIEWNVCYCLYMEHYLTLIFPFFFSALTWVLRDAVGWEPLNYWRPHFYDVVRQVLASRRKDVRLDLKSQ